MRRVARVTEDLGRGGGAFYVEVPDIPEGLTCKDWRVPSRPPALRRLRRLARAVPHPRAA